PLRGSSTYAVLLLRGIQSASGKELAPTSTWALVRQAEALLHFPEGEEASWPDHNATPLDPADPDGLASLQGLDLLWRAHAPLLSALDLWGPELVPEGELQRTDVLLAWAFDTQTLGGPLDPRLPGSPAAQRAEGAAALVLPPPLAGQGAALSVEELFGKAVPGVPCAQLGCEAI